MTGPKDIDRADVLGELEHRFRTVTDDLPVIGRVLDELVELDILRYREPADDPSEDPIGTVRTVEPAPEISAGNTVVKFGDSFWLYPSKFGNGYGRLDWAKVRDSKVIGAVPGTPAADKGVGLPMHTPQQQWETDDLELAVDPHEPVVLKRADTAPRVFSSDGPEPPPDVTLLERINFGETRRFPYAKRGSHGWVNCETPDADTSQVYGFQWPPGYDTSFREVIS